MFDSIRRSNFALFDAGFCDSAGERRTPTGFGREVTEAMEQRRQSLVSMGHAVRLEDGRIRVSKDFIANLERTEVNRVGRAMAAERGPKLTTAKTGEYVSGTLVGSTQLASGRFAMIDDGIGFQLVPWQPLLEKRIGRHITGFIRDAGGIEWSFGRKRGLGLCAFRHGSQPKARCATSGRDCSIAPNGIA
jgi:hypothetical protein